MWKLTAVLITVAHLFSFTYMIFFVDWLGWDIIEPLTFSVGTIYLLLAMRFYRKFYADRTPLTLRDRFRHFAMKPNARMQMRVLENRLNKQNQNISDLQDRFGILKGRLSQSTSLLHQFR